MDETREGIEYQREVSELLASRISQQDEEEVLEELAKLQQAEVKVFSYFLDLFFSFLYFSLEAS